MSVTEIILEYVSPALGVVIGNCMFAAPYKDLRIALENGNLGDLNPIPWAFMLANCFGWVLYSVLLQNLWIFFGNAPGFLLSIWLNIGAIKLLNQQHYRDEMKKSLLGSLKDDERQDAERGTVNYCGNGASNDLEHCQEKGIVTTDIPSNDDLIKNSTIPRGLVPIASPATTQDKLILGLILLWVVACAILAFVNVRTTVMSEDTKQMFVGILNNVILVFFYGAPLSTIFQILKDRETRSLHIPTMMLNTLNGAFWMIYGFAIEDYYVSLPNALGALLGGLQIVLLILFPRRRKVVSSEKENDERVVTNSHDNDTVQVHEA